MKTSKLVLVLAIALAACPAMARAQYWGGEKHERIMKERDERIEQIYGKLQLSPEQITQLRDNKAKHKQAVQQLRQSMKSSMEAVGEELKKKDVDTAKLDSMIASVKQVHGQMLDERFASILAVRKILTPEQFAKFTDLLQEHKKDGGWRNE